MYLARIDEVNHSLHPVTEVNPDAIEIAATLDAQRANGTVLGFVPLPISAVHVFSWHGTRRG